jgi:hypothetical protein
MSSRLVRLYPEAWRARYADEFESLLEARPLGPFEVADIVLGALDARLRGSRSTRSSGGLPPISPRAGGYAALFGGVLWAGGLLGIIAGEPWSNLGIAGQFFGTPALLVALVCLVGFAGRNHRLAAWSSVVVALAGQLLLILGMWWASAPWDQPVVGPFRAIELWVVGLVATNIASALFGIAIFRAASLSRRAAGLLATGSGLLALALVPMWAGLAPEPVASLLAVGGVVASGAGWVLLGLRAYREQSQPARLPAH